ncbi:MAG: cobalamin adenosyltransferase [Clostridia bacterium]|nr:cobalamin adenosyltransferase [Clostridia bacterium]MBR5903672.1 cobalamin adenosyltransferase [Clostridia bacterium]
MRQKILTDTELRARMQAGVRVLEIDEGTILTPAAKDYLKERNIDVRSSQVSCGKMTVQPLPAGEGRFVDAVSGERYSLKPEHMTHLHSNVLVPKTHKRIAFRGKLDCLQAQLIGVQMVAFEEGKQTLCDELDELLDCLRQILAAEVKNEPLKPLRLLNMDSDQIRYASHHIKETTGIDHPIPSYKMGRMCVALNRLRTQVREVELAAACAFEDEHGNCTRTDILQALNRLSSCVYILLCRTLAGVSKGRR